MVSSVFSALKNGQFCPGNAAFPQARRGLYYCSERGTQVVETYRTCYGGYGISLRKRVFPSIIYSEERYVGPMIGNKDSKGSLKLR